MGDVIKDMLDAVGDIARHILKKEPQPKVMYIKENASQDDDLLKELKDYLANGKICEAEDYLFDVLESQYSEAKYLSGLMFYDMVEELSDDFLLSHNFSREEIDSGIESLNALKDRHELIDRLKK